MAAVPAREAEEEEAVSKAEEFRRRWNELGYVKRGQACERFASELLAALEAAEREVAEQSDANRQWNELRNALGVTTDKHAELRRLALAVMESDGEHGIGRLETWLKENP